MSEGRTFVLGVDLDGVCADYTAAFAEVVARAKGCTVDELPPERSWDFHEWGFAPDEYDRLHKLAVTEYDMILTMPVIEGAADALWRLSDAGIWLRIITHRLYVNWAHERAVGDTAAWLDEHRNGLDVFVHGLSGDELKDHTDYAYWLGNEHQLDLSMFQG